MKRFLIGLLLFVILFFVTSCAKTKLETRKKLETRIDKKIRFAKKVPTHILTKATECLRIIF